MLQSGRGADLALEPLDGVRRQKVGRKGLDHHVAPELAIGGQEHARHATASELTLIE